MAIPFIEDDPSKEILDSDWVLATFALSQGEVDESIRFWATFSSSIQKVTDSSLGGNIVLNPLPQFSPLCDPCLGSMNQEHTPTNAGKLDDILSLEEGLGQGAFYSKAFDDNMQIVRMQFGTIRFKGVLSFLGGMYSANAGLLARQGRSSITYWVAKTLTTIVTLPLQVILVGGQMLDFFMNRPSSSFAYLEPAMGPYWNKVTLIMNMFTSYYKITQQTWENTADSDITLEDGTVITLDEMREDDDPNGNMREYASKYGGSAYRKDNSIDMYKVANRVQRMFNAQTDKFRKIAEDAKSANEYRQRLYQALIAEKISPVEGPNKDLPAYLDTFHKSIYGSMLKADVVDSAGSIQNSDISQVSENTQAATEAVQADQEAQPQGTKVSDDTANSSFFTKWTQGVDGVWKAIKGWGSDGAEYLKADFMGGSQFLCLRTDYTGGVTFETTNSTTMSEIEQRLNGFSKNFSSKIFSFGAGNTGIGIIDEAKTAVQGFIMGTLDAVHLSGLYSLMGMAYVDIPHHWDDSDTSFPTMSYSVTLSCVAGDALTIAQTIGPTVSALIAGAFPQSAGGATYTTPMYCSVHDQGRCIIRLGMIDKLSLEWGTGGLGFNKNNQALDCKISWSIKDLSSRIHAPVAGFNILSPQETILQSDSRFNDMIASNAGLPLSDMLFPMRKIKLAMTTQALNYDSFFSVGHWSNTIGNNQTAQTLAALMGFNTVTARRF